MSETTRVDRWLWAVRVTKTRTVASDACAGGRVTVNGRPAKAATKVVPGDEVVVSFPNGRERRLEVVRIIEKRVGAAVAADCLIDRSPPPPPREKAGPVAVRDPGSGRPTKKERRQLDRLRGRRLS